MPWKLIPMTATNRYRRELRRYSHGICAGHFGYHNATVIESTVTSETRPHDDDRIEPGHPTACGCGYVFTADDETQVNFLPVYEGGGEEHTLEDMPIGACWSAPWLIGTELAHEDQPLFPLMIQLPNRNRWCADMTSESGGFWNRSGPIETLTVTPSINCIGRRPYHGFIQNGYVTDDCEGRKF